MIRNCTHDLGWQFLYLAAGSEEFDQRKVIGIECLKSVKLTYKIKTQHHGHLHSGHQYRQQCFPGSVEHAHQRRRNLANPPEVSPLPKQDHQEN